MPDDALLEKAPKNLKPIDNSEYVPTPEALRLAYYLADPTTKIMKPSRLSSKFNIPRHEIQRLLHDKQFLRFLNELVPVTSDILITKAYKRLNKEIDISPYVKGNKGVEASKIVLQTKGHIKPHQTNTLNLNLSLEDTLDLLLGQKKSGDGALPKQIAAIEVQRVKHKRKLT